MQPLSNPPIREAIITVAFAEVIAMEVLQKFRKTAYLTEHFPLQQSLFFVQMQGQVNPAEMEEEDILPINASRREAGYAMTSKADSPRKVLQTKIGQLSFHLTHHYESWEKFFGEFCVIWETFCSIAGPVLLSHISLRYVNEIRLPLPLEEGFDEYLLLLPQIPEGINNNIGRFFLQLDIPNEAQTLDSTVTETFVFENEATVKVLLDINVQKEGPFPPDDKTMWHGFEEMRDYKNLLFNRCLTPKALEKYA